MEAKRADKRIADLHTICEALSDLDVTDAEVYRAGLDYQGPEISLQWQAFHRVFAGCTVTEERPSGTRRLRAKRNGVSFYAWEPEARGENGRVAEVVLPAAPTATRTEQAGKAGEGE